MADDDVVALWLASLAPAWQRDALCKEYPGLDWFPSERTVSPAYLEQLAAICGRCLVRVECTRFAHQHEVSDGVWGGRLASELRAERRRRAA